MCVWEHVRDAFAPSRSNCENIQWVSELHTRSFNILQYNGKYGDKWNALTNIGNMCIFLTALVKIVAANVTNLIELSYLLWKSVIKYVEHSHIQIGHPLYKTLCSKSGKRRRRCALNRQQQHSSTSDKVRVQMRENSSIIHCLCAYDLHANSDRHRCRLGFFFFPMHSTWIRWLNPFS